MLSFYIYTANQGKPQRGGIRLALNTSEDENRLCTIHSPVLH